MSNKEIKTVLIGFSLILFTSLYYNISKSTASTTADNIQAVVSIITLIVSIITIYFVYKAYQSQRDQMDLQRKEIDDNRKDVEFNRAVDILYKQFEGTNKAFKEIETRFYDNLGFNVYINLIFENIWSYCYIFHVMIQHYTLLEKVIDKEIFTNAERAVLYNIINQNINDKPLIIFINLNEKLKPLEGGKEYVTKYKEFLDKKFLNKYYYKVDMKDNDYDDNRRLQLVKEKFHKEYSDELILFDILYSRKETVRELIRKTSI